MGKMVYSKSRKVNTLVKLTVQFEKISQKHADISDEILIRKAKLTGGQMAEYLRVLKEHDI